MDIVPFHVRYSSQEQIDAKEKNAYKCIPHEEHEEVEVAPLPYPLRENFFLAFVSYEILLSIDSARQHAF